MFVHFWFRYKEYWSRVVLPLTVLLLMPWFPWQWLNSFSFRRKGGKSSVCEACFVDLANGLLYWPCFRPGFNLQPFGAPSTMPTNGTLVYFDICLPSSSQILFFVSSGHVTAPGSLPAPPASFSVRVANHYFCLFFKFITIDFLLVRLPNSVFCDWTAIITTNFLLICNM